MTRKACAPARNVHARLKRHSERSGALRNHGRNTQRLTWVLVRPIIGSIPPAAPHCNNYQELLMRNVFALFLLLAFCPSYLLSR